MNLAIKIPLILATLLVGVPALYLHLHPTFGGNPSAADVTRYKTFPNYVDGRFVNPPQAANLAGLGAKGYASMIVESWTSSVERRPRQVLPVAPLDWKRINGEEDTLTWFGHSTFLLSLDKKKLLVDPMFGPIASPVSFIGTRRFSTDILHIIDALPPIDAVLITHDHYDHLDYASILKLKSKAKHFFVPHGVGAHLVRWGVKKENITEMNWWDEQQWQGLSFTLTPAQHFSGRSLGNRNSTLWGGWAVKSQTFKMYISGDSGYGGHFKQIGSRLGPFNMTLIEGGQYDARWKPVHATPEEAAQAHQDVGGHAMMLMHWGGFRLAYHDWREPAERAVAVSKAKGFPLVAPRIGETVQLHKDMTATTDAWWANP